MTETSDETLISGASGVAKRVTGSDYYATTEDDPLATSHKSSGSFKKKTAKVGSKRTRIGTTMALQDNAEEGAEEEEEEDIVAALENSVAKSNPSMHLATKKARHEAQVA